jgi:GR25 family glycosyltransferase involved in LPS biosynthesis
MIYDLENDYKYELSNDNIQEYPQTWDDVLNSKCYVINLERNPERWNTAKIKIKDAGFTNFTRFTAVDGKDANELKDNWELFRNPKFADWDKEFIQYPGKQGCFLSHFKIWKEMLENKTQYAVILEDDVIFHHDWNQIAPVYFNNTPKDFDILYFGSQFEFNSKYHVDKGPVFCTHAMMVSLNGAKKMYEMFLNKAGGVYTIDCMIIDMMKYKLHFKDKNGKEYPFKWYVWNARDFFPSNLVHMPKGWTKRNCGLVFQDESYGSEVRPW